MKEPTISSCRARFWYRSATCSPPPPQKIFGAATGFFFCLMVPPRSGRPLPLKNRAIYLPAAAIFRYGPLLRKSLCLRRRWIHSRCLATDQIGHRNSASDPSVQAVFCTGRKDRPAVRPIQIRPSADAVFRSVHSSNRRYFTSAAGVQFQDNGTPGQNVPRISVRYQGGKSVIQLLESDEPCGNIPKTAVHNHAAVAGVGTASVLPCPMPAEHPPAAF